MRIKSLIVLVSIIALTGCFSSLKPSKINTDSQKALTKQEEKINKILDKIDVNGTASGIQTSALSYGVQYSLSQVENPSIEVGTAKALNERVISIIGSPNLDEAKRIKATVDLLNSEIAEERKRGESLLKERDKIIIKLQKEKVDLTNAYEDEIDLMSDKAKQIAKQADANQSVLDTMGGMMGLNAVFWGIKKFFFTSLTWIVVFAIIFLILRIAAMSNPIAAAAFSIFNLLGSLFLSLIKALTPQAFEMAKYVPQKISNEFKDALVKIVDSIQLLKEKQKDIPDKTFTLQDILNKLDKEMDVANKQTIEKILKEEKWKM